MDAFGRLSSALSDDGGLSEHTKSALDDIQKAIAGKSVDEVLKNPIQGAIELADELGKEPPIFEVTDPALRIPSKTSNSFRMCWFMSFGTRWITGLSQAPSGVKPARINRTHHCSSRERRQNVNDKRLG